MSGNDSTRRSVRFILNGEIVEVGDVDPNRTLLRYLREERGLTGTKEGCAEGDCGACTVVIADIDQSGERLSARAINSCIAFLPTLDGKAVFTVEGIGNGALHPAQQAMVDCHGSQCGFCTPGFVMSLFALYKNNPAPSRRDIDDALAGNLCRCTGYQPIVNAANAMYSGDADNGDWRTAVADSVPGRDEAERVSSLRSLTEDSLLVAEHNGRSFHAPRSVDELADLAQAFPEATLLAGGTDVGLWVTKDQQQLEQMIWTGGVAELLAIKEYGDHTDIGAAVTLSEAMGVIVSHYPAFEELFLRFASPPIRNAATLGGNIANGSPIGDSMPALIVIGAELVLRKGSAERIVALEDFYLDYRKTALSEGEFIERIRIPHPHEGEQVASYKVSKRFDQDISAVCGAYRVRVADGIVHEARIAYGGMAAIPKRASRTEDALTGQPWRPDALEPAINALDEDFQPISDMRASDDYRRTVSGNLLRRFVLETSAEQPLSVYRYER